MRVPFQCSGGLRCGFFYSREPICGISTSIWIFPRLRACSECAPPPVLAPMCTSPSGAAAGPAAGYFTCANPSAAFPLSYAPSITASRVAFAPLHAASPRRAFAPSFATVPGPGYAGDSGKSLFWGKKVPRNALACSCSSLGLCSGEQQVQKEHVTVRPPCQNKSINHSFVRGSRDRETILRMLASTYRGSKTIEVPTKRHSRGVLRTLKISLWEGERKSVFHGRTSLKLVL